MFSAVSIASRVLDVPPATRVRPASQLSPVNVNYDIVYPHTVSAIEISVVEALRSYLKTIPFVFTDYPQYTAGRVLESKEDVRLSMEGSVVLTCWPIVLSMVPPTGRSFDLRLRSEKSLAGISGPDLVVLKTMVDSISLITRPITALEFKAPGALSFLGNGIPACDNDDWERVTSQLRKYSQTIDTQDVIVMDEHWCLYLHFKDSVDPEAPVEYIISSITGGGVPFPFQVTARELFLLAAYRSISSQMLLHDYQGISITAGNLPRYVDGILPVVRQTHSNLSTMGRRGSRNILRNVKNMVLSSNEIRFPNCAITAADITPLKDNDSGFLSNRRTPRHFFVSGNTILSLFMSVSNERGRVFTSTPSTNRGTTSPPTSDLCVKIYSRHELIKAYEEASAYTSLKHLQGYNLPFCYGYYNIQEDMEEYSGLLLENLHGKTLHETLSELTSVESFNMNEAKYLYCKCVTALKFLHRAGFAHSDISGDNIIIEGSTWLAIFVDLEYTKPISHISQRLDYGSLRLVFCQFGLTESVLRSWT